MKFYFEQAKKPLRAFGFIAFASFVVLIFFVIDVRDAIVFDFISYLTGAKIIISGFSRQIFEVETQKRIQNLILNFYGLEIGISTGFLPFLNLPTLALLFIPFTFFTYLTAYKIYIFTLFICLIFVFRSTTVVFKNLKNTFWPFVLFLFYPLIGSVLIGQLSVLLVLVFLVIYKLILSEKFFKAGIVASLLLLKTQYIIFIPLFLVFVKEKKDFVKGTLASGGVLMLSSLLVSGNYFLDYFNLLTISQSEAFGLSDKKLFTLYGTLKQIVYFQSFSFYELFAINLLFYLTVFLLLFLIRKKMSLRRGFIVSLLLSMVFCLHGVDYDQSLLIIPIFYLLSEHKSTKGITTWEKGVLITLTLSPILIILEKGIFTSLVFLWAALILTRSEITIANFKARKSS